MEIKTRSIILAALLTAMPMSLSAGDGAPPPATETTQWLNFGELSAQTLKQIDQYKAQLNSLTEHLKQTEMMIQNLKILPAAQWSEFTNDARSLANIVQNGQAVSFAAANLDDQFAKIYKGYTNYETLSAKKLDERTTTFSEQYRNINASNREAVYGALKGLNFQMNALISDDQVVSMLKTQSQSADGQLRAIQAANEIALHQTDTLKKLHYTLMTQASTQAQWIAAQNDKDTAKRALSERRVNTHKTNKTGGRSIDSYLP
ncbi:P-type conjugative transfer protein TrbJ [Sulfuricurvum sp.]|uniref:P-type conjugative transfer protein TrbJ n=1 Tax=Sulfuricurvum sp. TaxID=2025608 RepID=UPI0026397FD0|nr:P-type conjugative transfer protein TrbJ [Sulfuricurvum sp.]MDD4883059.1 P-type conjugative transfer protein TrbJ [Sulfuricurvum sp.]